MHGKGLVYSVGPRRTSKSCYSPCLHLWLLQKGQQGVQSEWEAVGHIPAPQLQAHHRAPLPFELSVAGLTCLCAHVVCLRNIEMILSPRHLPL